MREIKINAVKSNISKALHLIEDEIKNNGIDESSVNSFLLYSEEILLQLIDCSEKENNTVTVRISGKKKNIRARFSCCGKELTLSGNLIAKDYIDKAEFDDEQTTVISKMILKSNPDRINIRYKRGINIAQLNAAEKSKRSVGLFVWMLSGLLLGFILKVIGNTLLIAASSNIFSMVSTMFMNAIKMLVTPLVFFSIADSITGFSDLGTFGRVGGKVIGTYIGFSILSLFIAFGVFSIIKPGSTALMPDLLPFLNGTVSDSVSVSLRNTIMSIIPSGFVSAFAEQNMMQIIFIAVLSGIVSGKLGQHSEKVQSFFSIGNSFFSELIAMVIKTLKPVCLCMMADVALSLSASSFVQQLIVILCIVSGCLAIWIIYGIAIALISKINPFIFLKKIRKAFFVAFTTMSSSATIPTSMQCCDDMGISPKVYSFSIPLGATINMNASCMFLMTITLFIAGIMGIQMSIPLLITEGLTILLLAVSAPGIPGAALACLTIILSTLGVPSGAVGYIMGIYTITDGLLTAGNILGDAVTSLIVAKSENFLDEKKLRS